MSDLEKGHCLQIHCLHPGSASMATMDKVTFLKWLKDPDIKQALQNNNKAGIHLIPTYTKTLNERFHLLAAKVNWNKNTISKKESITDLLKTENKGLKSENQRLNTENEELKLPENVTSPTPICSTPVSIPAKKKSNQMMAASLSDTTEDEDHPFNLHFSGFPEADPDVPVVNTKEVVDFSKTYLKVSVKPTGITSA